MAICSLHFYLIDVKTPIISHAIAKKSIENFFRLNKRKKYGKLFNKCENDTRKFALKSNLNGNGSMEKVKEMLYSKFKLHYISQQLAMFRII
jgi:hypothetical protein